MDNMRDTMKCVYFEILHVDIMHHYMIKFPCYISTFDREMII